MKLKSLQMLWAITLPFRGAYDMLATFNEILFKMPQAAPWDSMLKCNLKNCCWKAFPLTCLHLSWLKPTQRLKAESHVTGNDYQVSYVPDMTINCSPFSKNIRKNVLEMFGPIFRVTIQTDYIFIHWYIQKLKSFLFSFVNSCWQLKIFKQISQNYIVCAVFNELCNIIWEISICVRRQLTQK